MLPPTPSPAEIDPRLEELLDRYRRLIGATVRRLCPSDLGIDAQDVEQEARLRLWRALSRATETTFGASYVQRVAATAAIDAVRAALARRDRVRLSKLDRATDDGEISAQIAGTDPSPEAVARGKEIRAAIERSLAALPPARERAVRLHLVGLSSREIARATGWSETKIRSLVSRGLADLRRRLRGKGVEPDAG